MERRDGFRMALVLAVACVGMWAVASSTTPGTRPSSAGDEHHASAPREAAATTSMFTHLGTEAVTPDGNYLGGSFVRIYDSATTGRLLVTCNTPLNQPEGGCQESAHVYKEYTTDLQETGNKGMIACAGGDIGSLLVGNTYYLVTMHKEGEQQGWQIATYDATSWTKQIEVFRPVDYPRQVDNDPMVAYVNGQIDVSSQYNASGTPADPHPATFHLFFTTDLQFVEERILDDTPGVHGSSMIYLDGVYYLLTANAYLGDLVVMMYDCLLYTSPSPRDCS